MFSGLLLPLLSCGDQPREEAPRRIAERIVRCLKAGDWKRLANSVHPRRGLRFSPYVWVDYSSDLVFFRDEIPDLASDSHIYSWGAYDGTGERIRLCASEYLRRFVYDVDYAAPDSLLVNGRRRRGCTNNNIHEVYPDGVDIEFYRGPSLVSDRTATNDWKSLHLVLEKESGQWWLVGIVHDRWTM
jgi:hypothetical protein